MLCSSAKTTERVKQQKMIGEKCKKESRILLCHIEALACELNNVHIHIYTVGKDEGKIQVSLRCLVSSRVTD